MKPNLSNLTGAQLFDFYTSQNNEYKQVLFTAHEQIGDDLFKMLETAEKGGKKIVLKDSLEDVNDPPITIYIE
jgi:hypothetical protein